MTNSKPLPSFGLALAPIAVMFLLLAIGYGALGLRIEVLLLISAAFTGFIAWKMGYNWDDIIGAIVEKLAKAMPVILILVSVGGLIASWMVSGTIPYMVYWGLKVISPEYILIAAFFVTSVVSVCTGTSWGSAGTVGVALMGVAAGLDVSLAAAAGAVVSGAYFGDKISPLSDSTNFAPVVSGTTLYEHIQHMLYTTLPGFVIAATVFFFAGQSADVAGVSEPEKVVEILAGLESLYNLNIVLIIPPVMILWGALTKKPVLPLMLAASAIAIALGMLLQGFSLQQGFQAYVDGFNLSMFEANGHEVSGIIPDVAKLLNRGGLFSMMSTILLVFCAFSFAGILSLTGALNVVLGRFLHLIHSTGQLITSTVIATITVVFTTSDGKLALLIPGELFQNAYRKMGLDTKNLSRTIEDAGTIIEPLVPWTAAGIYMAGTLGVATLDYLPWAIQCYTGVIFALIYGFTGFGIAKAKPESTDNTELQTVATPTK
ncbi:Malate-2H(+)/Na(+)-lactate antiporter [Vibrio mediterranei]|uniref:Na+/H+ antiporter NhaC n=1 Tax=Vibrio mediterranei TaxID=689 RepID=A0ABX5D9F6_9VIBR|nr:MULTISPECIES: Na+/H+ antiporter NhaC [Vibrio]MCF4175128.1 Na+/H+ antiporter NhaC [Vibrio sp. McD22-P3]MCG9657859.1 Na+/H+ antiporter NhaC [Vibrio mediterranei]MCG9662371.1 Na+/H+ antiporter NhaC [Vibrio mediterranei]PCD87071.1 Na+/H+ antiporter NhaC [Vibrio mediterranei]PRQ65883.1 Na+/H+ antiporter NhaC [Vibrio mediterranei]